MSDPSMEDILASIRKILSDETAEEQQQEAVPQVEPEPQLEPVPEVAPVMEVAPVEPAPVAPAPAPAPVEDDVFDLSAAQVVAPAAAPTLVAQPVAKASACTLSYLAQMIAEDKRASMGNAGLTIEEIVKESIRPIIKEWLNQNLYDMVEKLVRQEIEKVVEKVQV